MAGAKERGFAFVNLPVVIDPVQDELSLRLRTYGDEAADDVEDADSPRFEDKTLTRVRCVVVGFPSGGGGRGMNFYGDDPALDRCRFLLAYDSVGVLQRIMYYKDGEPYWERFPEELTGDAVHRPSIRFVLNSPDELKQAVANYRQLQGYAAGQCSMEVGQQAATALINILLQGPEDPRTVTVVSPTAVRELKTPD